MTEFMEWKKPSRSGSNGNCVEVALGETVAIRDTKDRDGGTLTVPAQSWAHFLAGVSRERKRPF